MPIRSDLGSLARRALQLGRTVGRDQVRQMIQAHIAERYGSNAAAARAWEVSDVFVGQVLRGAKPAPEWLLGEVGLACEREVRYVRKLPTWRPSPRRSRIPSGSSNGTSCRSGRDRSRSTSIRGPKGC